jgi:hypothetical protein
VAAGLARQSRYGELSDVFRDRVMVPIRSQGGSVVGFIGRDGEHAGRTLIAHWNGKTWAKASSPDLGSFNEFNAVAASSADDVWAVGAYSTGGPDLTLAMHCC